MTTTPAYHEFKLHYRSEYSFTCFARHIGEAVEQLNDLEGDGFNVLSDVDAAYVSKHQLDGTYSAWEPVNIPNAQTIKR